MEPKNDNPEEIKQSSDMIKGMRELENKNII